MWGMPQLYQRYRNAIVFWGGDPSYKAERCMALDWTRRKSKESWSGVQPDSESSCAHATTTLCTADIHPRTQSHSGTADLTVASLAQSGVSGSGTCKLAPKISLGPTNNITVLGAPGQLDSKNHARTSGKHHAQHIRSTAPTGNWRKSCVWFPLKVFCCSPRY